MVKINLKKDKFTVEIATDVVDTNKHITSYTAQSVEDFNVVQELAKRGIVQIRNKFAPKNHTCTCELDASFEFGGEK